MEIPYDWVIIGLLLYLITLIWKVYALLIQKNETNISNQKRYNDKHKLNKKSIIDGVVNDNQRPIPDTNTTNNSDKDTKQSTIPFVHQDPSPPINIPDSMTPTAAPQVDSSIPPNPTTDPSAIPTGYLDPASYGYVFLLFGDITEINCDCWLGSGGASLDARHLPYFPKSANIVNFFPPSEEERGRRSMYSKLSTYSPWPENLPVPYTIHLKSNRTTEYFVRDTERFIRIAAEDIHKRKGKKIRKGVCPLLAMPLIGTGFGGNFSKTGEMMKSILPLLYSLAEELKIDIALVFIEKEVFSLAQAVRRRFLMEQPKDSPLYQLISGKRYLQPDLLKKIPFLASQASQGELTLFVGAGVSMGAGLPSWDQLLTNIAKKLDFSSAELKEFESLDYYSRAAVLEQKIENQKKTPKRKAQRKLTYQESFELVLKELHSRGSQTNNPKSTDAVDGIQNCDTTLNPEITTLYDMVAKETQGRGYTVMHSLIASLPVTEIITTNYDEMMERAWQYAGHFSVLPYSPLRGSSRWMLKLHGTVSRPKEIVLTKRDYIRYNDRFAALAGIVQSTLLTRHLLSIGFSLADDNFHKIFDSVRKAKSSELDLLEPNSNPSSLSSPLSYMSILPNLKYQKSKFDSLNSHDGTVVPTHQGTRPSNEDCYCTALILKYSRLKHLEWLNEIDIQYIEDPNAIHSDDSFAQLARRQEIFVDILSSHCSRNESTKFLMKERYLDALSEEEKEMKEYIQTIINGMMSLSSNAKQTKAFQHLRKCIQELGG